MQSSSNKTVEGAVLFPVARSVALRSFRETITWRSDAAGGDKDAREERRGSVAWLGDRNKKRCLFLYLCAIATTGVFPHARDRTCTAI